MSRVGFESTISVFERENTVQALKRAVTASGPKLSYYHEMFLKAQLVQVEQSAPLRHGYSSWQKCYPKTQGYFR
jgi:hypothetical protein